MGHHEDGGPQLAVHVLQGGQEHLGRVAVQGAGGFVGQDQFGVVDDGPGAGAPLLLPAGDLIGVLVQNVPDVQGVGHGLDLGVDGLGGRAADGEGQGDVLPDGEGVQEVKVLEDEAQVLPAELGQLLGPQPGDVLPIQADGAGTHRVDGGDAVEQGGLAGAGGPHDSQKLPVLHGKADVVDGAGHPAAVAVDFLDVFQLQQWFHGKSPHK